MSLKFTEDLCVMAMKNDAKFEKELTCFKIDTSNLTNFKIDTSNFKDLNFNGLLLNKVYYVWAEKNTEESCFITLKSDAKFEEKRTYSLENDTEQI